MYNTFFFVPKRKRIFQMALCGVIILKFNLIHFIRNLGITNCNISLYLELLSKYFTLKILGIYENMILCPYRPFLHYYYIILCIYVVNFNWSVSWLIWNNNRYNNDTILDKQIIVLEADARNGKSFLPATTRCIKMNIRGTYVQLLCV